MSEFYAHTAPGEPSNWERLFTSDCAALSGGACEPCEKLEPAHGHLNKVAWWTARFAEEMFPIDNQEGREAARRWGYLAGLWHDLGKFHPLFQRKLFGERLQIEHAGAGAVLASAQRFPGWEVLAFVIAGHHAGLANWMARVELQDKLTALDERLRRAASSFHEIARENVERLANLSFVCAPPAVAGKSKKVRSFAAASSGSCFPHWSMPTALQPRLSVHRLSGRHSCVGIVSTIRWNSSRRALTSN